MVEKTERYVCDQKDKQLCNFTVNNNSITI